MSSELVRRLRFLVSLNDPERGGPYGGSAAEQCMIAMADAADLIEALSADASGSAHLDYPELASIARGAGCQVMEDAEAQAGGALDEINRLRALILDELTREAQRLGMYD